ncbi:MAG: PqqD family protein [Peptococcaceae bacterium]|nr:PqqD family protein [Peptococcaceae bacterium]
MKIKDGYLLREVAGNHVVVPTGKATLDFSGVITLNGAGAFLWRLLNTEKNEQELLSAMLGEYEIDAATAQADLVEFVTKLKEAELLA